MARCTNCSSDVVSRKSVCLPIGGMFCQRCFDEGVWTCDLCGKHFANPDFGGEAWWWGDLGFEQVCERCHSELKSALMVIQDQEILLSSEEADLLDQFSDLREDEALIATDLGPLHAKLLIAEGPERETLLQQLQLAIETDAELKDIVTEQEAIHKELDRVREELAALQEERSIVRAKLIQKHRQRNREQ